VICQQEMEEDRKAGVHERGEVWGTVMIHPVRKFVPVLEAGSRGSAVYSGAVDPGAEGPGGETDRIAEKINV
jgi:hypothetical protein